ncbi:MAG TPA: UDP-N-acetylglucosamine 2-epimerase (non-hydrolyzing) [Devosiaceae bacterium]|nr:UDP-N-acetylglucosamine 2-epimerase (non-hydrolyzing) [Devosiaceae bacterium]
MHKILVVYGTRPEAIKVAPLIGALGQSSQIETVVAVTGQHRQMLDQVNSLFGIVPRYDLNIIVERQQLQGITSRALEGVSAVIATEQPDAVLVQGDTTTCFAAALAAFYQKVPVIHLEAGLRTGDTYNPFPEEVNRRLVTRLSALHLAPTSTSRQNLIAEGVPSAAINVTGNTVIDALLEIASRRRPFDNPDLGRLAGRRTILVTAHRRESWGEPMARAAQAMARIARNFPDVMLLLPAHLNPAVREVLLPHLTGLENVLITEPLGYGDFVKAMLASTIILTDSGGVQEEAPSLGKPVLVMRETTERPEAVVAGTVRLVGTDEELIVREVTTLLTDRGAYETMAHAINPYGDGHASDRCVQAIEHFFRLTDRPVDFFPGRELVHWQDQAQAPRVS